MFGRATTYDGNPAGIDEAIAFARGTVQPFIATLPGSLGLGMWCNRETGHVTIVTAWADRASLDASAPAVKALREQGGDILGVSPSVMVYEPVVLEQKRGDQVGYWTRTISVRVDPAMIPAGVDLFRTDITPQILNLPGCTGVMLGVNRDTGQAVVATTFDGRASLDATREAATRLREASAARTGAIIEALSEDEVMIVGIRGPEMPTQATQRTIELPTETSV